MVKPSFRRKTATTTGGDSLIGEGVSPLSRPCRGHRCGVVRCKALPRVQHVACDRLRLKILRPCHAHLDTSPAYDRCQPKTT